ncbi:DUF805 domain-containing protein [Tabrizicola sp.]|uniref:DUF805 domain-containing protein n=1 Tax=Tabrizicola sp. TaxID=2005166 RepID=UPI00286D41B5|nr:DUF805 domain-containing protein [Tabrizicola sp.]
MAMLDSVKRVYNSFAKFSGRAKRPDYWWFFLFQVIVTVVIAVVEGGGTMSAGHGMFSGAYNAGPVGMIWSLVNFIPGLAVSVRRLHDLDKSGWWLLIALIPLIGAIVLIVWFASRGTVGSNRFGEDPVGAN